MKLYFKCNHLNKIISKKQCNKEEKCNQCQYKQNVIINWHCKEFGMDIKKKLTYCPHRTKYNIKCESCPQRGENFEAKF